MQPRKPSRMPSPLLPLTALLLVSACASLSPASKLAATTPALCATLQGGPEDAVSKGVLADDASLNGQGAALLPWDAFKRGFDAGCKTAK